MRLLFSAMLLGLVFVQPVSSGAGERRDELPAAVTDMPDVIDISYASPDTWHALPPSIYPHEKPPLPALDPNEVDLPSFPTQIAILY